MPTNIERPDPLGMGVWLLHRMPDHYETAWGAPFGQTVRWNPNGLGQDRGIEADRADQALQVAGATRFSQTD